jgi:hypothetical protein
VRRATWPGFVFVSMTRRWIARSVGFGDILRNDPNRLAAFPQAAAGVMIVTICSTDYP